MLTVDNTTTDLHYVVAGPEYWDSIPQTRQLTCGRVRFTAERILPPLGAGSFLLKQQAMLALKEGDVLVRETHLGESSWHYQLLSKK
jgi:hypothetical protein